MAFVESQKTDIRFFLGYPMVYRQSNPRLENAIDVVGSEPTAQLKVEMLLERLNTIYGVNPGDPGSIDNAVSKLGITMVKSADDEVRFGDSQASKNASGSSAIMNDLNMYGKQLAGALSSFFGVPIASNVFGPYGYVGDQWKFNNGMSTNFLMNY